MSNEFVNTFGAEIEKPIADLNTWESHGVSQAFFRFLQNSEQGATLKHSDIQPQVILGAHVLSIGDMGLDNAFNLQETASRVTTSLSDLEQVLKADLNLIQDALAAEGATVINLSTHPLVKINTQSYERFVAPKGVYAYILARGWDHKVGIDAKAQNSPATSVNPKDAAVAVSTIIGAGAAVVGLFGNSPFADQKLSPYKESRLMIWDKMMRHSKSAGDRKTAQFPDRPFLTLKEYFDWMFGDGTNIHFVLAQDADYKTFGDAALTVDGDPSVLSFLALSEARASFLRDGKKTTVTPHLSHLEVMQFAQFIGARIRWKFDHSVIDKEQFLQAFRNNTLEELFANGGVEFTYIEGRDAGAIFPDQELLNVNETMAKSSPMAPSAFQAGLLQNLDEARRYIQSYPWKQLKLLRDASIKDGLEGNVEDVSVYDFTQNLLAIALKGLASQDQRLLAYPQYVLQQRKNGADRALEKYEQGQSIHDIVKSRAVITRS